MFKFIKEPYPELEPKITVTVEVKEDARVHDMLEAFVEFLVASGYDRNCVEKVLAGEDNEKA